MTVRVAVDALGGDHAPDEVVAGAVAAASETITPVLFGPAALDAEGLDLVVCAEAIGDGREARRGGPREADSSLVRAARPSATATPMPWSRQGTPAPCSPPPCSTSGGCRASCGRASRS